MANLIDETTKLAYTGALNDHFDTFSRDITIFKKPQIDPSYPNESNLVGYGEPAQYPNITYTINSGIYPAIRMIKNDQPVNYLDESKVTLVGQGKVRIKVREDAKNFIENGPNERVVIDSMSFNFSNEKYTQNYLGLIFYIYHLEATN